MQLQLKIAENSVRVVALPALAKEYVMRSVRVFFKKEGRTKYISHLDLNRFMLKIIRKSKIPVWFSEGYNPHPYITFALPLSLGFESDYEVMDIRLDDDSYSNDSVFNALSGLLPVGFELIKCTDPIMKAGQVCFADYKIVFDSEDSSVVNELYSFLKSDSIISSKKTKKGTIKEIDLKNYIKDFSLNGTTLNLTLAAGGSNNLNPKLVLDAYSSFKSVSLPYYTITRTMLYNDNMEIFK